ncbi:MAG: hypothetical protein HC899_37305 [Leptolyngbyaceae cyanobacterium SM1_4_3]|nr:hypothetical protein [Leptolyngbyaceae cyanobacterium SM1_4_3]
MSQASSDIVTIQGPLWSAQARLLDLAHPQQNKALRTLFLEHVSNTANPAYRPGTVIALCDVRQVTVRPGGTQSGESYVWKQTENRLTEPLTPDRIRELLKTGRLSLLLLSPDYKPNKPNDKPTRFTCLTGEIYLNRLHPEANARHNLFSHLPLARLPMLIRCNLVWMRETERPNSGES